MDCSAVLARYFFGIDDFSRQNYTKHVTDGQNIAWERIILDGMFVVRDSYGGRTCGQKLESNLVDLVLALYP